MHGVPLLLAPPPSPLLPLSQHFFTTGEKEVRAWSIPKGACAPEAGGAIHSDFRTNFISAEVCSYTDFASLAVGKSYAAVKEAGKMRSEGKTYVVADGDIIKFLIGQGSKK